MVSSSSVIDVDDLHVEIDGTPVLVGVNLSVEHGTAVGLVGETGSGKSMTVRAITGLLRNVGGQVTRGSIRVAGGDMTRASTRAWRRLQGHEIALVPQSSMSSLDPVMSIGRQLTETIKHAGHSEDVRHEIARLLEGVKLEPTQRLLRSYAHELSGGMRQRVMISLALATRPKILVADEPTTALDAAVRLEIIKLLGDLRREQGLSLLMISHDIRAIGAATDRAVVMYAGRTVESGPTAAVLASPTHPYTRALLDALPVRTPPGQLLPAIAGHPPHPSDIVEGCPFATRCPAAVERCQHTTPDSVEWAPARSVSCLRPEHSREAATA